MEPQALWRHLTLTSTWSGSWERRWWSTLRFWSWTKRPVASIGWRWSTSLLFNFLLSPDQNRAWKCPSTMLPTYFGWYWEDVQDIWDEQGGWSLHRGGWWHLRELKCDAEPTARPLWVNLGGEGEPRCSQVCESLKCLRLWWPWRWSGIPNKKNWGIIGWKTFLQLEQHGQSAWTWTGYTGRTIVKLQWESSYYFTGISGLWKENP